MNLHWEDLAVGLTVARQETMHAILAEPLTKREVKMARYWPGSLKMNEANIQPS